MKIIHSETLQNLPREVAELVRDGVYSLYTVDHPDAAFVLVTDRGAVYLLTSAGGLQPGPEGADLKSMQPKEAVAFSDASPYVSTRINLA
jgi:hypothetical protein